MQSPKKFITFQRGLERADSEKITEQQQQHAITFDMKFVKLLDIVKTELADHDEAARSFISRELVKMMLRKLTTKALQKIEEYRNLTGVFIDSTPD
jgi:hypothetical protein